jgi:hypothetical protein
MTISLEDRLAIHELISTGGQSLRGLDAIKDAAIRLGEGNPVGHHVTNIVVDGRGDHITARSKAIGVRQDGSTGSLDYDDVLLPTEAGWRISKRTITLRREPLHP